MRRAAHNAMTGLMVGGLLSLLVAVSMSVAAPAAEASPAENWSDVAQCIDRHRNEPEGNR